MQLTSRVLKSRRGFLFDLEFLPHNITVPQDRTHGYLFVANFDNPILTCSCFTRSFVSIKFSSELIKIHYHFLLCFCFVFFFPQGAHLDKWMVYSYYNVRLFHRQLSFTDILWIYIRPCNSLLRWSASFRNPLTPDLFSGFITTTFLMVRTLTIHNKF